MPTLIHLIAQRVFRSGGARADRDVGVFGYACFALVEYPCCRNWFGVEGRGGERGEGKGRGKRKGWRGGGSKRWGGGFWGGRVRRGDERREGSGRNGWGRGGDVLLLASLLAVEPVFWTFSEIWLPKSLEGVLEVGFGG